VPNERAKRIKNRVDERASPQCTRRIHTALYFKPKSSEQQHTSSGFQNNNIINLLFSSHKKKRKKKELN
jgi:hypothetical protein